MAPNASEFFVRPLELGMRLEDGRQCLVFGHAAVTDNPQNIAVLGHHFYDRMFTHDNTPARCYGILTQRVGTLSTLLSLFRISETMDVNELEKKSSDGVINLDSVNFSSVSCASNVANTTDYSIQSATDKAVLDIFPEWGISSYDKLMSPDHDKWVLQDEYKERFKLPEIEDSFNDELSVRRADWFRHSILYFFKDHFDGHNTTSNITKAICEFNTSKEWLLHSAAILIEFMDAFNSKQEDRKTQQYLSLISMLRYSVLSLSNTSFYGRSKRISFEMSLL